MDKTLIQDIHSQWVQAKRQAQEECENRSLFNMAEKYRACSMFKGTETIEEVLALFTTPQGIEFCSKHSFPTIEMCRKFKSETAERLGIFVESDAHVENLPIVILIGKCHAELEYNDPDKRHQVVLMHGASARIKASNWAVVFVSNAGDGSVEIEATDNAKVL